MENENSYVKELAESLINTWLRAENGEGLYKYAGGYWEVLLPILRKYVPKKLKMYENMLGVEFNYSNEKVKELLDAGDEETNMRNAIEYINNRIDSFYLPSEVHFIDDGNGEDIPYIPNQNIDINQYYGRDYD